MTTSRLAGCNVVLFTIRIMRVSEQEIGGWSAGSRRTATNSHRWKDDVLRSSCDSRWSLGRRPTVHVLLSFIIMTP